MLGLQELQNGIVTDRCEGIEFHCDALEYFTCGHCNELAEAALEIMPERCIIEVRIDIGSFSQLIHAGLSVGNDVLDIEGVTEKAHWQEKWAAGLDASVVYRNGLGDFLGYERPETASVARVYASHLVRLYQDHLLGRVLAAQSLTTKKAA